MTGITYHWKVINGSVSYPKQLRQENPRPATAGIATQFLDEIIERMSFEVKAIQIDGGSEFQSIFEEHCQQHDVKLFVLPLRSPQLNRGVGHAHRTHTEEFYGVTDSDFSFSDIGDKLRWWEVRYDMFREVLSIGV